MTRLRCAVCAAFGMWLFTGGGRLASASSGSPFEFFAPWVVVSESDRRRLRGDEVLVRKLHGGDGQLAVFAATRVTATPDALVAWTRAIAELKRSRFVPAVGRFSDPPALADLDGLTLDDRDVASIRECLPGDCGLKLTVEEIESLRAAVHSGGAPRPAVVEDAFRRLLVARVNAYRAGGLAALAMSGDRKTRPSHEVVFSSILAKSPYLKRLPAVEAWLLGYPGVDDPRVESFFYWSKEYYGAGKPVIAITHVGIVRPQPNHHRPDVLVMGKQIFATHYVEGALGLTAVIRDAASGDSYLVYINRSQLDLFRGFFGGLARSVLEGRLERQAPALVRGLRRRLESGSPADATVAPVSP